MRLRAAHLAFLMLLLSSLGAAEASALPGGRGVFHGQSIGMMLQQNALALQAESPLARHLQVSAGAGLIASPGPLRTIWTMRPPAAHSAHQHAVTASRA